MKEGLVQHKNCFDPSIPALRGTIHPNTQLHDQQHPNYPYYKALNFLPRDCLMFNRYMGRYQQMGQTLTLQKPLAHKPHKYAGECVDTDSTANFPLLMEWINRLPIFESIGRVNMFFNAPGEASATHRDQWAGYPDNYVLINLHPDRKQLFILDDQHQEHVITSRACCFDNRNYHGSRGLHSYGWTLRVDGIFRQSWAESLGIWLHFRPTV
jgi:hypothetical protein